MRPPVRLIDGILWSVLLEALMRQYKIRQVIKNVGIIIDIYHKYGVTDISDFVHQCHNTHGFRGNPKFFKRIELCYCVILTIT